MPAVQHHHLTWRPEACLPVKSSAAASSFFQFSHSGLHLFPVTINFLLWTVGSKPLRAFWDNMAVSEAPLTLFGGWHSLRGDLWILADWSFICVKRRKYGIQKSRILNRFLLLKDFCQWRLPPTQPKKKKNKSCWLLIASCCWGWTFSRASSKLTLAGQQVQHWLTWQKASLCYFLSYVFFSCFKNANSFHTELLLECFNKKN